MCEYLINLLLSHRLPPWQWSIPVNDDDYDDDDGEDDEDGDGCSICLV